jgi:ribosomal protein S18 acetylase RimI-like enzyme
MYKQTESEVKCITKKDLLALEPLLAESYGPGFDFSDELDYFDPKLAESWFYVTDHKLNPQGFVRLFPIDEKISSSEIYVRESDDRPEYTAALLKRLSKSMLVKSPRCAQFITNSDEQLIRQELERAFSKIDKKNFLYYEKDLLAEKALYSESDDACKNDPEYDMRPVDQNASDSGKNLFACSSPAYSALLGEQSSLEKIRKILSVLKSYSIENLRQLAEAGNLMALFNDKVPVAALHLQQAGKDCYEIITIACDREQENKGFATRLLQSFFQRMKTVCSRAVLRVSQKNSGAIRLYEKTGFKIIPEKKESWFFVSSDQ